MPFPVINSSIPKQPIYGRSVSQCHRKEDDSSSVATSVISDLYSVSSLKAELFQLDQNFDQPLPKLLDVDIVFAGSKFDALEFV